MTIYVSPDSWVVGGPLCGDPEFRNRWVVGQFKGNSDKGVTGVVEVRELRDVKERIELGVIWEGEFRRGLLETLVIMA